MDGIRIDQTQRLRYEMGSCTEDKNLKTWNRVIRIALIMVVLTAGLPAIGSGADSAPHAKGVILFIGDGMGINQVRSAAIYSQKVLNKPLAIDSIANRGTTTTYSANSEVTDSAAAATALYSGHKVNNGAINVLPNGSPVFSIAHAAKQAGLSVGVLTTTRLTHATPAGAYGRVQHRDEENLLAEQLVEFEPEVAMGGGIRHFIPQDADGSKRKDDKNLIEVMQGKGYNYAGSSSDLKAIDPAGTSKLVGLFAMSHMAYELDRQHVPDLGKQPDLAEMTKVALSILERNPHGFFLVVEGGRIDHACHSHDIKASIYDTLAFDEAVKTGLEFQKKHPDVLVLVTADHETGGMGLGNGIDYALDITALRPIVNTIEYINKKIQKHPGDLETILKSGGYDLTEEERALFFKYPPETQPDAIPELNPYSGKIDRYLFSWIHYALGLIQTQRSRVGWTSFVHTAQPVITYAVGPGADRFSGHFDNTDIPKKMAKLMGLVLAPPAPDSGTTQ